MSEKNLEWYKEALQSEVRAHAEVTRSYMAAKRKLDAIQALLDGMSQGDDLVDPMDLYDILERP